LVARFVRDEEAAGSNPVTPTNHPRSLPFTEASWLEPARADWCYCEIATSSAIELTMLSANTWMSGTESKSAVIPKVSVSQ
jgi:hypothetical protein